MSGNEKALTAAPGIGEKIAQRVIMELKDKFSGGAVGDSSFRFFRRLCARGASGGDKLSDAAAALGDARLRRKQRSPPRSRDWIFRICPSRISYGRG